MWHRGRNFRERVRVVDVANGDLGAERAQRLRRFLTAHRGPHLIAPDERRDHGATYDPRSARHHHRHGVKAIAAYESSMDTAEDLERITRALGQAPIKIRPAGGHGAPSNRRWLVRTAHGRAFVKIAAYDYTADWLRLEHRNYTALQGLACMPELLGWDDDGVCPALAIERLSRR